MYIEYAHSARLTKTLTKGRLLLILHRQHLTEKSQCAQCVSVVLNIRNEMSPKNTQLKWNSCSFICQMSHPYRCMCRCVERRTYIDTCICHSTPQRRCVAGKYPRNMKHMQTEAYTYIYIYIHAASEAHNGERIVCVCACLCICVENDDDDNAVVLVARTLFFSLPSILACTCIFRTQRSLYTRIHTYKHTERQKTRSNDVHRQRQFVN